MALGVLLLLILGWRAFDALRSPALPAWLTEVPNEPDASQIDTLDWKGWLAAEDRAFADVDSRVIRQVTPDDRGVNRRFALNPEDEFGQLLRWNRTQVLVPDGKPRGAAVMLHGLTDSPYSLRHIAIHYLERGFAVVAIRLPGHGTVPAALTKVRWEDWAAATRLAVRHARELAAESAPLHIVGYSNGAALAMNYTLDSIDDPRLPRPNQLVLISPMIGITSMARFAGVLGWPAAYPPFAKSAWLDIQPEYNPFKYNSFAVNAARQSSQLTRAVQNQLDSLRSEGELSALPPILTFQSAVDYTVDVRALVTELYGRVPENGSELIVFGCAYNQFLKPHACDVAKGLVPDKNRNYAYSFVTNFSEDHAPANGGHYSRHIAQGLPDEVYSLSHVALPFPEDDETYGPQGFGGMEPRGERGALIVSMDSLMRMTWNPFFPYMLDRIDSTLPASNGR